MTSPRNGRRGDFVVQLLSPPSPGLSGCLSASDCTASYSGTVGRRVQETGVSSFQDPERARLAYMPLPMLCHRTARPCDPAAQRLAPGKLDPPDEPSDDVGGGVPSLLSVDGTARRMSGSTLIPYSVVTRFIRVTRFLPGRHPARLGKTGRERRHPQCIIKTGNPDCCSMDSVMPPNTRSRSRECPYPPMMMRSAEWSPACWMSVL